MNSKTMDHKVDDKIDDEMDMDEFMNDGIDETQSVDMSDINDHVQSGYFNAFNSQMGQRKSQWMFMNTGLTS